MPLAESYISGGEYTITLDGFVLAFETGSMWDEWAVDEMTNSKTQRHYDDVKTIRKGGLTGVRAVYEKGIPPTFKSGRHRDVRRRGTERARPVVLGQRPDRPHGLPGRRYQGRHPVQLRRHFVGVFTMTHG
jgi:hypothetical protein